MSRPRFLADHDLNEVIIDGVLRREPSLEFIRARDVGLAGRPDPELLEYGARQNLILVSHDVNTMPAHAADRLAAALPVSGVIMVRQSLPVVAAIEDLVLIWSAREAEDWTGLVTFLPI